MRAVPPLLVALLWALPPAAPRSALHAEEPALPPEVQRVLDGAAHAERAERCGAAEAAKDLQHPALLPVLVRLAKDDYRSVREPAWRALATRAPAPERAKAARAAEARLKELDRRPAGGGPGESPATVKEELLVVVQALHDLAQPASVAALIDGLTPTTEADVASARLRAVANVPTKEAVERLLTYAARGRREESHRGATLRALEYATGVKLAHLDAWQRWWSENQRTYDPEAAARARGEARAEEERKATERAARRARRDGKDGGEAPDENEKQPPPKDPPPAGGSATMRRAGVQEHARATTPG